MTVNSNRLVDVSEVEFGVLLRFRLCQVQVVMCFGWPNLFMPSSYLSAETFALLEAITT